MTLKLDYASYEATKYACVNFHYSKTVPAGKLIKIGVWEHGKFIGVVLYGRVDQCKPRLYIHKDSPHFAEQHPFSIITAYENDQK